MSDRARFSSLCRRRPCRGIAQVPHSTGAHTVWHEKRTFGRRVPAGKALEMGIPRLKFADIDADKIGQAGARDPVEPFEKSFFFFFFFFFFFCVWWSAKWGPCFAEQLGRGHAASGERHVRGL